jgi:hypothetical protein
MPLEFRARIQLGSSRRRQRERGRKKKWKKRSKILLQTFYFYTLWVSEGTLFRRDKGRACACAQALTLLLPLLLLFASVRFALGADKYFLCFFFLRAKKRRDKAETTGKGRQGGISILFFLFLRFFPFSSGRGPAARGRERRGEVGGQASGGGVDGFGLSAVAGRRRGRRRAGGPPLRRGKERRGGRGGRAGAAAAALAARSSAAAERGQQRAKSLRGAPGSSSPGMLLLLKLELLL